MRIKEKTCGIESSIKVILSGVLISIGLYFIEDIVVYDDNMNNILIMIVVKQKASRVCL